MKKIFFFTFFIISLFFGNKTFGIYNTYINNNSNSNYISNIKNNYNIIFDKKYEKIIIRIDKLLEKIIDKIILKKGINKYNKERILEFKIKVFKKLSNKVNLLLKKEQNNKKKEIFLLLKELLYYKIDIYKIELNKNNNNIKTKDINKKSGVKDQNKRKENNLNIKDNNFSQQNKETNKEKEYIKNTNKEILLNINVLNKLLKDKDLSELENFYYTKEKKYSVNIPDVFGIKNIIDNYIFNLGNNLFILVDQYKYVDTNNLNIVLNKTDSDKYYKIGIYKNPNHKLGNYRIYFIESKNNIKLISPYNPLEDFFSNNNINSLDSKGIHYIKQTDILTEKSKTEEIKIGDRYYNVKMLEQMIINKRGKGIFFLQFRSGTTFYLFDKKDKTKLIKGLISLPLNSFVFDYNDYVITVPYGGIGNKTSPIKSYYIGPTELYKGFNKNKYEQLLKMLSISFYVLSKDVNYKYSSIKLFKLYSTLIKFNNINDIYNWIVKIFHYDNRIDKVLQKNISQSNLDKLIKYNFKLYQIWNVLNMLDTKSGVCSSFTDFLGLWGLIHGYNIEKISGILDNYNHVLIKIGDKYYDVTNDIGYYKMYHKYNYFGMNLDKVKEYMKVINNK